MLFEKLTLKYFGRFQNREIELKPGINLVYGDNEAGKSTIHTFIKGMLFGIERLRGRGSASKEDLYTRYLPWDYPGAFGGSMDIRIGDKDYRLQRSFHANDKSFTVIDLATGREVKLKEGMISDIIPGLTEATFKNTISIEQLKAQTDTELAAQVRNYITNLSITRSKEVNVTKAVNILTEQRKQLEASQSPAALKALQAEIEEGLAKEERMDQLTIQLRELLIEEQQLKGQKEAAAGLIDNETADRMEQLPAILEKYRSYQELNKQDHLLDEQMVKLQEKIAAGVKDQMSVEALKEDILETEKIRARLVELEKKELEFDREQDLLKKKANRNLFVNILPACLAAVILILATGFSLPGIIFSVIAFVVGVIAFVIQNRKNANYHNVLHQNVLSVKQQITADQTRLNQLLYKNKVSKAEELAIKQEELLKDYYTLEHSKEQLEELKKRRTELEDSQDVIYETIMKYIQYFIPEEELTLISIQRLQEEIQRKKQEASNKLIEISRQYESCKLRIEKIKWEISTLEDNEAQLLKNKEIYKELEQKQKESTVELEAIKLALTSIKELSTDIHDSFGYQLNKAVSEVISEMTGQKYTDLLVDEKLDIKVGWNGHYVLLDRLSAGTIDQMYFALRLAVADLLLGNEEIPLLLDDSFALYDDARVKASLKKIAKRKQIILFTCHKRERLLLKELGLPYHLIDLS